MAAMQDLSSRRCSIMHAVQAACVGEINLGALHCRVAGSMAASTAGDPRMAV